MNLTHAKLFAASLAALSLTMCGGGAAGPGEEDARVDSGFVEITDQQGSIEEFEGAVDDASVDRCEATDTGWIGEGTITNPTDEMQSYRIYVAFNKNRDTKGLVQIDLDVAPGEQDDWRAEAPINGDDLNCVLRVERFAPQH